MRERLRDQKRMRERVFCSRQKLCWIRTGRLQVIKDSSQQPPLKASEMALPVQLVREEEGKYVLCEDGCRFLQSLKARMPIGLIGVAGKYRTGKSFLLNRGVLGAQPSKGFVTGCTVNACTKGIWLHPSILYSNLNGNEGPFLVMDTEGTASLEATAEQDASLIGIALALCSVFVYNSQGSIDEAALSDLATLTSVASAISQDASWSPPQLVWTLRDFTLRLEDDDGTPISSNAYLERALSEDKYGKADVRSALRSHFPKRALFTMVRPCVDENRLQKLNAVPNSSLRPEFKQQLEEFRVYVRSLAAEPKIVGGIGVDGPAMYRLLASAVEATNSGQAPSVKSTFSFLQEQRMNAAIQEAIEELRDAAAAMRLPVPVIVPPTPKSPLFLKNLPEAQKLFTETLALETASLLETLTVKNADASRRFSEMLLSSVKGDAPSQGECSSGIDQNSTFEAAFECFHARGRSEDLPAFAASLHQTFAAKIEAENSRVRSENDAILEKKRQCEELLEEKEKENLRIRDELDDYTVAQLKHCPIDNEEAMAELRSTFVSEMATLMTQRDEHEARALQLDLQVQAEMVKTLHTSAIQQQVLEIEERLRQEECAHAETNSRHQEALERGQNFHKSDIDALRSSFQQILQQTEARAKTAEEQREEVRIQLESAEARSRHAEELAEYERVQAQEKCKTALSDADEHRRKASLQLAQRAQLMKESHESIIQENQKARERAATAERLLMTLEVQNESLKRKLEVAQQDSQEINKLRRLSEEHKGKLGISEAALERATNAAESQRRLVRQQEEELRVLQQRLQDSDRERTLRIAQLEMELQGRGLLLPA